MPPPSANKAAGDITRSSKQGYQWPSKFLKINKKRTKCVSLLEGDLSWSKSCLRTSLIVLYLPNNVIMNGNLRVPSGMRSVLVQILPPYLSGSASRRVTLCPCCCRVLPAVRPLMPAPTTITSKHRMPAGSRRSRREIRVAIWLIFRNVDVTYCYFLTYWKGYCIVNMDVNAKLRSIVMLILLTKFS